MYAYTPHSYFSQLACAGGILLFFVGLSTQATVTYMPMIAKMARIRWMRRVKQGLDQEINAPTPGLGLGQGLASGPGLGLGHGLDVIPAADASCYPECQCGPNCTCGPACGSHGNKEAEGKEMAKNGGVEGGGQGQPVVVKGNRDVTLEDNQEENEVGAEGISSTDIMTHPIIRTLLWWTPRVCSGLFLVLLLIWLCGSTSSSMNTTKLFGEGGFVGVSKGKMRVFGWHALFMTLFAVVFTNEG